MKKSNNQKLIQAKKKYTKPSIKTSKIKINIQTWY